MTLKTGRLSVAKIKKTKKMNFAGSLLEVSSFIPNCCRAWINDWPDDFPNTQPGNNDFVLMDGDIVTCLFDGEKRGLIKVLSKHGPVWVRIFDLDPIDLNNG